MTREDAIGVIKGSMPTLWKETRDAIQTLIPELAESEDEGIRKKLVQFLSDIKSISESGRTEWAVRKEDAELCKAAIIYLEKQKEQKSAECTEDSVKFREGFKAGRESGLCDGQKYVLDNLDSYGLCKSAEWSEEDKLMRGACIAFIQDEKFKGYERSYECIDWLKSLRLQSHWKPSEEQMEALNTLLCNGDLTYVGQHSQLQGLYNELKKL